MKTPTRLFAWLTLAALAVTRLHGAIESVKIEQTYVPWFSPVLLSRGITEGKAVLVLDVSPEGKITDSLVLGSTDKDVARFCLQVLQQWNITPARIDGRPVAAQVELTMDVSAQGAVISRTAFDMVNDINRQMTGNPIQYERSLVGALDQRPTPLTTVMPKYAKDAEKQGVRGKVQVRFFIDEQGMVRMPAVDAGAQPYLADAALTAVRDWKFAPPTSKGRPVLVAASQEFDFSTAK